MKMIFGLFIVLLTQNSWAQALPLETLLPLHHEEDEQLQSLPFKEWITSTRQFRPGTHWPDLDERQVFFRKVRSHDLKSGKLNYEVRVGKGSQIYSLRIPKNKDGLLELIPPQVRTIKNHAYFHNISEWNDEVLQTVMVNTVKDIQLPNREADKYQIHSAGTYRRKGDFSTFYSPLLYSHWDEEERSLSTISWPQQAHVPSKYQSHMLLGQKLRFIDEGIIEVTRTYYNFGWKNEQMIDYIAQFIPIHHGNFPVHRLSKPNGTLQRRDCLWPGCSVSLAQTGGYSIFSHSALPSAPSMAIIYGRKGEYRFRWGMHEDAKEKRSDLMISSIQQRLRFSNEIIRPGQVYRSRFYIVINQMQKIPAIASRLVNKVEQGHLDPLHQRPLFIVRYNKKMRMTYNPYLFGLPFERQYKMKTLLLDYPSYAASEAIEEE